MKTVLLVHGIGNQKEGWSKDILSLKSEYNIIECLWDKDINDLEKNTLNRLFTPNKWSLNYILRMWMFNLAVDVIGYVELKKTIMRIFLEDFKSIPEDHEIILAGKSLGSWVIYDFLLEYPEYQKRVKKMISFGSNLPLYRLDNYGPVADIPWVNIWEKSDLLSMPLKKQGIRDMELKSRHPLMGWNPLAHNVYRRDTEFIEIFRNEVNYY